MKGILILVTAIFFTAHIASAAGLDTVNWYEYNGYSTQHSFSILFPSNWKVKTYGDDLQGIIAPKEKDPTIYIQEFEGYSYKQVAQFFEDKDFKLVSIKDQIFPASDDILSKEAVYQNGGEIKKKVFIKRGSLIVSITVPPEDNNIANEMFKSFKFKDDWHQYIDFREGYTFIFPKKLDSVMFADGVEIIDDTSFTEQKIFEVFKYKDVFLDDAPGEAEGYGEDYIKSEDTIFHGIENAIKSTYEDNNAHKKFSLIFVENKGAIYSITDKNIESNFPHFNYYDDYLAEVIESFEFFELEGEHYTYQNFPDVKENHKNAKAIDSLTKSKIISGYPDGKFKPDGEINRAELTKMIVVTKAQPTVAKYSTCFLDVGEEWFAPYICYAKEKKWVEGYKGNLFKPEQKINRAEAIKIILELMFDEIGEDIKLNDNSVRDIDQKAWYANYFNFADNEDLLDMQHIKKTPEGYYYEPDKNITRKEVAEMIYRSSLNTN